MAREREYARPLHSNHVDPAEAAKFRPTNRNDNVRQIRTKERGGRLLVVPVAVVSFGILFEPEAKFIVYAPLHGCHKPAARAGSSRP